MHDNKHEALVLMMLTTQRSLKPCASIRPWETAQAGSTKWNGRYLWIHRKCLSSDRVKTHTLSAPPPLLLLLLHMHKNLYYSDCVFSHFFAVFFKRAESPSHPWLIVLYPTDILCVCTNVCRKLLSHSPYEEFAACAARQLSNINEAERLNADRANLFILSSLCFLCLEGKCYCRRVVEPSHSVMHGRWNTDSYICNRPEHVCSHLCLFSGASHSCATIQISILQDMWSKSMLTDQRLQILQELLGFSSQLLELKWMRRMK